MARRVPRERNHLIYLLKWKAKKKEISGPVFVAIIDRIAKLDGLYDAELTKPKERPDKLPNPLEVNPEPPAADDDEAKELLDAFNKKHYGGENVGTTTTAQFGITTSAQTGEHTNSQGSPEGR